MFYSIRHSTRFRYSQPVRQSVMEVMMQPRSEGTQAVRQFDLTTDPRTRIFARRDFLGNIVHHFDIPGAHTALSIIAETLVEVDDDGLLPQPEDAPGWDELDAMNEDSENWDYLTPSKFCHMTPLLREFKEEIGLSRRDNPLQIVIELNEAVYEKFAYVQRFTRADSPIDVALEARKGVCQDFSHVMISLLRDLGIPARYISGYLYHRENSDDRSVADATHAWVEALLPGDREGSSGWIGFDPTNKLFATQRHIRTAIGRDYADVPPTHGIYRGKTKAELQVAVSVTLADAPRPEETKPIGASAWMSIPDSTLNFADDMEEMVQQQQQ